MVDNKLRDNAGLSQRDLNKTSKLLIVWEINENVESNLFNNTADIHTYTYICTINRRIPGCIAKFHYLNLRQSLYFNFAKIYFNNRFLISA